MIYDIAILGSGPASLFAAMELVNNTDLKVIILEKARRLNDSRNVMLGWLGGASRSNVRLFLDPKYGGEVASQSDIDVFQDRIEMYSGTKLRPSKKKLLKKSVKRVEDLGIELYEPKYASFSEEKMIKLGDYLYSYLRERATVVHKLDINDISKDEDGNFKISTQNDTFMAKKCIMGLGKIGARWLNDECRGIKVKPSGVEYSLGFRLEFPTHILKPFSDKGTSFRFKFGDFYTTTPIFGGTVETEENLNIITSGGRGKTPQSSPMTNFALMRKFKSKDPIKDVYRVSEIVNVLAEDQLFKEPLSRVMDGGLLAHNLEEFTLLSEGLEEIVKLMPEIKKRCTVYGPEAKLNCVKYSLGKNMQSRVKGLYIVGDMSGKTNSFVQAACSGIKAANDIIKKIT